MFDLGISHLVVIAIVGILVLGPEKLPGFVRDSVRIWRIIRGLAADAQVKITGELFPDMAEEVRVLNPRQIVERVTLSGDADSAGRTDPSRRREP